MTEIRPVNNANLYENKTVKQNAKVEAKTPEEVKDGKKKMVLALGALGIAGAAGIAVAAKKGKINFSSLKNIGDDVANAATESQSSCHFQGTVHEADNLDMETLKNFVRQKMERRQ